MTTYFLENIVFLTGDKHISESTNEIFCYLVKTLNGAQAV